MHIRLHHAALNVALLDLPSPSPDRNLSHIRILTAHVLSEAQKCFISQDITLYQLNDARR